MPNPHEGREPHPKYGAPLGGKPETIDGVTFRPYRRGISLYVRVSDDFRIEVFTRHNTGTTYFALVDGVNMGRDFRSQARCYAAAIAKARETTPAA